VTPAASSMPQPSPGRIPDALTRLARRSRALARPSRVRERILMIIRVRSPARRARPKRTQKTQGGAPAAVIARSAFNRLAFARARCHAAEIVRISSPHRLPALKIFLDHRKSCLGSLEK